MLSTSSRASTAAKAQWITSLGLASTAISTKARILPALTPTGKLTPLFNPRANRWDEHFRPNGASIIGLTPIGQTSVWLLEMNSDILVALPSMPHSGRPVVMREPSEMFAKEDLSHRSLGAGGNSFWSRRNSCQFHSVQKVSDTCTGCVAFAYPLDRNIKWKIALPKPHGVNHTPRE